TASSVTRPAGRIQPEEWLPPSCAFVRACSPAGGSFFAADAAGPVYNERAFRGGDPRVLAPTPQETPMNRRTLPGRQAPACRAAALAVCGGLLLWAAPASAGGAGKGDKGKPKPPDVRQAVGHVASPSATVFLCEGPGKGCRPLRERGLVF